MASVPVSGITAGTFFIVLPETSLKVEPDAAPSIVGRLFFKKKYTNAVPISGFGTTVLGIKSAELKKVQIDLPSVVMQRKISSILKDIDRKIRCNQTVNDNLEQQAAAYFQELFVANANPNWKVGTISDLGTVTGGSTPSKAKPEY